MLPAFETQQLKVDNKKYLFSWGWCVRPEPEGRIYRKLEDQKIDPKDKIDHMAKTFNNWNTKYI